MLEGNLTPEEKETVLQAITRGSKAVSRADDCEDDAKELQACLTDLEKAAGIIAQAMLRNPEAPGRSPSGRHGPSSTDTEPLSVRVSAAPGSKRSR